MKTQQLKSEHILKINCAMVCEEITFKIRENVRKQLRKRGLVVALSGGIDSSVVGALCVQALGPDHVLGLLLPEKDSSPETLHLSRLIGQHLGIKFIETDITGTLEAIGCYRYRDEAIRSVIPEYTSDCQCKIILPDILEKQRYNVFSVVIRLPEGRQIQARLPLKAYLQIVAASNFKQRVRKTLEYYHADRLNYAVTGTPNRLEYDQGFFVKQGDGVADIKPIAHLYKTQVYQMAEFFGLPAEIVNRLPTTDTYSMPQTQEEFYFSVPYEKMDLCLYGKNHHISVEEISILTDLTPKQVLCIYSDIENKRKASRYQHAVPILIEDVEEIYA